MGRSRSSWLVGDDMIDLDKLSELEKSMKPAPWYVWKGMFGPNIAFISEEGLAFLEQLAEEKKACCRPESFVISNRDIERAVEMRNQLPELIDYIKRLESAFIGIVSNEKHEGEAEKLIERLRSGEDIE